MHSGALEKQTDRHTHWRNLLGMNDKYNINDKNHPTI